MKAVKLFFFLVVVLGIWKKMNNRLLCHKASVCQFGLGLICPAVNHFLVLTFEILVTLFTRVDKVYQKYIWAICLSGYPAFGRSSYWLNGTRRWNIRETLPLHTLPVCVCVWGGSSTGQSSVTMEVWYLKGKTSEHRGKGSLGGERKHHF